LLIQVNWPRAFAAITSQAQALLILPDPVIGAGMAQIRIAELALKIRLPTMERSRRFADAGGLMSYGTNPEERCRLDSCALHPCERRRSPMGMHLALLLAAVFALSPLDGVAGEKQIVSVKELEGNWRGWVTGEQGDERATMIVSPDGSYKASTISGSTTVGTFYLQNGKLRYRSSRTTGTASVSEDKGKTVLTVMPEDPNYRTGRAQYERLK